MNIQSIALNRLIPSSANVRKTGASTGIEELAASIAAHGLLQNLQVRSLNGKGKYEVVAGGRRLAALKLLAKGKQIAKDSEIPCNVLDDQDAAEISLAENVMRVPMHPADQFEAFHALAETGKGPEEIAARFGTTPTIVRQRLKLASVSPRLLEAYRAEEMTLDELMAFTVSDDHEAQEAVWMNLPPFNRSPSAIRRALTEAHVEASDPRALFVGIEVYTTAGGQISRDLFQPEHEGYLTAPALLDKLVQERLEREAQIVRAEGWKWVETAPELDFSALRAFGRIEPERLPLAPAKAEELARLSAEYDALEESEADDPQTADRLDALSQQIETLSQGSCIWTPEQTAQGGVIVTIDHDGSLLIERGLIRPEDKKAAHAALATDDDGGEPGADDDGDGAPPKSSPGLSARLIEDLTAQRTAALRAMLADNPTVALAATVHALALPIFYGPASGDSCLEIRVTCTDLSASAENFAETKASAVIAERMADWKRQLPESAEALWDWLRAQDLATLTALLATCVAMTVNAVQKPHERSTAPHHADRLAAALALDMRQWWQPTRATYLARVPKAVILSAVAEGVTPEAAENLAGLKKDALVGRAEERLAGKGWLPAILRMPATQPNNSAA